MKVTIPEKERAQRPTIKKELMNKRSWVERDIGQKWECGPTEVEMQILRARSRKH